MAERSNADKILGCALRIVALLTAAVIVVILISSAIAIANGSIGGNSYTDDGARIYAGPHFYKAVNYERQPRCTLLPPLNMTVLTGHQISG